MKSCMNRLFAFHSAFILLSAACFMSDVPVAMAQVSGHENRASLTISENGKLSLKAQGVWLKTLLAQIQAKTNVQYTLSEKHTEIPIFLTFQSLSLHDAIKKMLHGISHACILDAKGHIERIITFSQVTSPGRLAIEPDESSNDYATDNDSSVPQETGMDSMKVKAVRMPPQEVMKMLEDEAAPVPPPDAIQDKE
jgi:hypothetical protein